MSCCSVEFLVFTHSHNILTIVTNTSFGQLSSALSLNNTVSPFGNQLSFASKDRMASILIGNNLTTAWPLFV